MEATTDALLYALRVNALTYEQLFTAMATYVSCTYGVAAYAELETVLCNHGIRDCAAPAPMVCEHCGNGVREGAEDCDGNDWRYASCGELPEYSGGTLTCDANTCTFDESQCTMPGLDTTASVGTSGGATTGADDVPETETGAAGTSAGSDGCNCRAGASGAAWIVLLPLSLLGATRRRRTA